MNGHKLQVFINKIVCKGFLIYTGQTELLTKNCGKHWPVLDQTRRRKWNWLGHTLRRNDDSITKQALYSGHHEASEEEGDQGILGKEIWKKKCGQQDTSTAGGRWRRQHKTELDGDKWSVAYVSCTGSDNA